jgi:glycine dehydrogenase
MAKAVAMGINLRDASADSVSISLDETTTRNDIIDLWTVLAGDKALPSFAAFEHGMPLGLPAALRRTSTYLTHPVFNTHHSETEMLRYIRALSDKDLALDRTMIPLGSCTMKLNATSEMIPITWPEFANIHPFAPHGSSRATRVAQRATVRLAVASHRLCRHQPAAQCRLARRIRRPAGHQGLPRVARRRPPRHLPDPRIGPRHQPRQRADGRHEGRGHQVRCPTATWTLTTSSAKCEQHSANLAAVMITYPSTYGVFETRVTELCATGSHSTVAASMWTVPT